MRKRGCGRTRLGRSESDPASAGDRHDRGVAKVRLNAARRRDHQRSSRLPTTCDHRPTSSLRRMRNQRVRDEALDPAAQVGVRYLLDAKHSERARLLRQGIELDGSRRRRRQLGRGAYRTDSVTASRHGLRVS